MKRLLLPLLLASCFDDQPKAPVVAPYAVKWVGTLREVHSGASHSRLALSTLAGLPHLYALGPLAGLRGEITILDSAPIISTVEGEAITINSSLEHQAALLVYAQVERWQELPIPEEVETLAALEAFLQRSARELGLVAPVPFLLKGSAAVTFHVLREGAPSEQGHAMNRLTRSLESATIEVLGFYSEQHQGVFTHHDSRTHMHLATADRAQAGHLDALQLKPGAVLSLPLAPGK